jgi:hypothetical protein
MADVAHDVLVAHLRVVGLGDEAGAQSACALSRSNPSTVSPAIRTRCARMRRTVSGCSVASPTPSPLLIVRNSGPALRRTLPGRERPHRTRLDIAPARRSPPRARPGRSCRAGCAGAARPDLGDVLDMDRNKFGAAQCAGEAEQQQRAVAPSTRARICTRTRQFCSPGYSPYAGWHFRQRQQMQWTKRGAHLLLQPRSRALDGTLRPLFEKWYPGLVNDDSAETTQVEAA